MCCDARICYDYIKFFEILSNRLDRLLDCGSLLDVGFVRFTRDPICGCNLLSD